MSQWRRPSPLLASLFLLFLALGPGILAQSAGKKPVGASAVADRGAGAPGIKDDEEYAKSVKEWTTRPEFISPLVDHLPKVAGIPSPKDVLGHHIGEPKKLTYYADILKYYRALAAATPRVMVTSIGTTDEGRELAIVFVGSDESIKNLEQYRTYLGQLADPRKITDTQANDIIAKAKPIYHLMGGLHLGEAGPSEMLMELAYRLAVEDSPLVNQIRDNVIVSITPVADPDGRDRNVDWFNLYGPQQTEANPQIGVPYWGKSVFHDDNRDINYSQLSTRALLDWYLQWHPPIMPDLHQAQTLLYTFSGQAPQNPNLDPILFAELPMMANFEMAQMTKYGMPGVWTHGFVDMWSPGYLAFMSSNHNGMIRMYEIQGTSGANTTHMRLGGAGAGGGRGGAGGGRGGGRGAADTTPAGTTPAGTTLAGTAPAGAQAPGATPAAAGSGAPVEAAAPSPFGGGQSQREWYRPWPATGEFDWSLRNNTNYGETGVLTALQYTATFSKIILENFYQKSRNSIDAAKKDAVAGYVIPAGQRDPTRVAVLVNLLRMQGIEIGRATGEVKLKEGTFPAGSFIVKRDQPYGRLAKILLEKQVYPDPNLRTYDDAAWTMGLMSQTDVKEIQDKAVLDVATSPVDEVHPTGTLSGAGSLFAVAHNGSNNLITLRYRLKDLKVQAAEKEFKQGDTTLPAGTLIIRGDPARVKTAIDPVGLSAVALAGAPSVPLHELDLPRIAVYSTWGSTQDVGWVRYAFDKFEVPYELIYKERARKGDLKSSYDVIVVPNQAGSGKRLVFDIEPRGTPIAYKKSDKFRNLGTYGESDDITGGKGLERRPQIPRFVKAS